MLKRIGVGVAAVLGLALLTLLVLKTPIPERAAQATPAPAAPMPGVYPPPVGPHVTRAYLHCIETARDEAEKSYCLGDELDRQNAALKTAFDRRADDIGIDGQRLDMIEAQKAWETWRDADCKAQRVRSGTSGETNSWLTCMVRVTATRAAEMPEYGSW